QIVILLSLSIGHGDHRALCSFPTRRSSDLSLPARGPTCIRPSPVPLAPCVAPSMAAPMKWPLKCRSATRPLTKPKRTSAAASRRSEEHTSELQSRENLVCRLLLEKKKKSPQ